jgi:hypothetical protein
LLQVCIEHLFFKYKCYFERTFNNVVHVEPCFVTLIESNTQQSKDNPCEGCVVHVAIDWIVNWTLMMVWEGLIPILYFNNFTFEWCPFFCQAQGIFCTFVKNIICVLCMIQI